MSEGVTTRQELALLKQTIDRATKKGHHVERFVLALAFAIRSRLEWRLSGQWVAEEDVKRTRNSRWRTRRGTLKCGAMPPFDIFETENFLSEINWHLAVNLHPKTAFNAVMRFLTGNKQARLKLIYYSTSIWRKAQIHACAERGQVKCYFYTLSLSLKSDVEESRVTKLLWPENEKLLKVTINESLELCALCSALNGIWCAYHPRLPEPIYLLYVHEWLLQMHFIGR